MRILLLCYLILLFGVQSFGQEKKEPIKNRHFVSVSWASGFVAKGANVDNLNSKGHFVPGVGADYLFRLSHQWEVGIMIDYELAHYVIPRKDELIRERALIMTPVVTYNIFPTWSVFVGGGIEIEKHENLGVFRLGTEYAIPLKNRWSLPIGVFADFKSGYQNFSLSVGIGRAF